MHIPYENPICRISLSYYLQAIAWSSKLQDLGKKQTIPLRLYQQATCPPSLLPYRLPSFIYKQSSTWEVRQMAKSLPWPLSSS